MPLHIEIELEQSKEDARKIGARIQQRKQFLEDLASSNAEAMGLHGKALKDDERILSEMNERIAAQEKSVAESKAIEGGNIYTEHATEADAEKASAAESELIQSSSK